jgi:hypothetical protein
LELVESPYQARGSAVKTKWNGWVFSPLDPRWARVPGIPGSWRRVFRGEYRTYLTDLPIAECTTRLRERVASESLKPKTATEPEAIGLVEERDFRIVVRGGFSGELGFGPMLYGYLQGGPSGAVIHAFQRVPLMVGLGVYAYCVICSFLMLIGPIPRFLFGNSLTNDFTFDLVILSFTSTSMVMVSGWMWFMNKDWDLPRLISSPAY